MNPNTPFSPQQGLRKLPIAIPAADAAPETSLIERVATAGDGQIVPFSKERIVPVGSPAVQILGSNPRRKAVWLRATDVSSDYLVLGSKSNWPPVIDSTNRVGFRVLGQEALTVETTDEIWVYNLSGAVQLTVIGTEILQSAFAK